MSLLHYVSHPEVVIDAAIPVPDWSLNERGRERARSLLRQPWLASVGRVISSPEAKAIETADVIAGHLGLPVQIRRTTGEVDRSATGYMPAARHEELADLLFAEPTRSAAGWERAIDAQRRLLDALADVVADGPSDVAVVGHGGVGTLLLCHLAGLEVDRRYDQPGLGSHWCFDRTTGNVVHRWRRIDVPGDR